MERAGPHSRPLAVADLHVHLEGSLAIDSAVEIARAIEHPWGELTPAELTRQFRFRGFDGFIRAIRNMCAILSSRPALERAARELSRFLARHGVAYGEVYCSPWIYVRWGMSWDDVFGGLLDGFDEGEREGGARCVILLDTVRPWGLDAATRILDEIERKPRRRVVGFGLGGEETTPLDEFAPAFERARELGLRTVAHAGEIAPASDVAKALDLLRVDRIAHGIRALDDPGLVAEIRSRGIPLDLAITSNYRTGAVAGPHPIRRLVDEGVTVTVGTDDPSLFRTDPVREMRRARRCGALGDDEARTVALDAVRCSFADDATRERLRALLEERFRGEAS